MYYNVHLSLEALYNEVTKILIMVTCCYKFKFLGPFREGKKKSSI